MQKSAKKFDPRVSPFKVIQSYWNRHASMATQDFLLMYHTYYRPVSYRFGDKGAIIAKSSPPVYLRRAEGFSSEFCNGGEALGL